MPDIYAVSLTCYSLDLPRSWHSYALSSVTSLHIIASKCHFHALFLYGFATIMVKQALSGVELVKYCQLLAIVMPKFPQITRCLVSSLRMAMS
jgi:hypothetical protein